MQANALSSTNAVTTDRILIQTMATAVAAVLGPKKSVKFLRAWAEEIAAERNQSNIVPIRGGQPDGLNEARDEATAWLHKELPRFLGAVHHGR